MKKIIFLAVIVSGLGASITCAETNVPGGSVSGTWTLAGSPYLVNGNIQIANDSTLSIQPGVTVIFQGTYKLNVQGRLLAVGTATDSITFTASNTTNGWRGIRFSNTPVTNDSSKIIFCKIQYGKATGSSPDDCGGAFYFNNFSKAIISNSSIINCAANSYGGGIYCKSSDPVITKNTISNNQAPLEGGGIFCDKSNPFIAYNTISNNTANCCAGSNGGGIYCSGGSLTINGNKISNNIASNGGGIFCDDSNSSINNNTITYNTAYNGGGINSNGNNPSICKNTIAYNTASNNGGGILCSGSPTINNNSFSNNTAINGGGLFLNFITNMSLSDNIICNNTASANGGGIYCQNSSILTFINSTITKNSSDNGGALYCAQTSNPSFRNCILYGNTASTSGAQVFLFDEASDPGFYFCDVQGGSAAFELNGNFYTGTYQNNINIDPQFVSASGGSGTGYNGVTADWSLQNSSPCVDKGDTTFNPYPLTDMAGNPRVNVCRIDIGAYEYQTGIPFIVSLNISQPIICNGGSTGELATLVSGGTLPYTYLWSNGQTTANITGLVAGNYKVTISTASYGCTLTKSITLTQPQATSINAGKDTTYVCGSSTQLISSPKWLALDNATTTPLNSVFFTNTNIGYAVGGPPAVLLKTIDAGQSWTKLSETGTNFRSVCFLNADTGFVVGGSGEIHKSTDGGNIWTIQINGTTTSLYSVFFINSQTGFITGDNGKILKTHDGGQNWTQQNSGTTSTLYSVYFTDVDTGYVVGASGTILKTTNSGLNWTAQNVGTSISTLRSVYFLNSKYGFASGTESTTFHGIILKTIDGGAHWTYQVNENMDQILSLFFNDGSSGYACGALGGNGKILETNNGGNSWNLIMATASTPLNSIFFANSNTGYVAGWNNPIYKLIKPVSYSWSPVNGLNNVNIPNPIANPVVTTNYIVTTTSQNGCIAKDTVTVFVNPLTANAGSDKTIICGSSVKLDSITSNYNGSGLLSYLWLPATGLNYDSVPNPTATVISSTKYFISVTTPNGCNATDSVKVIVNPLTVNSGTDKSIICGGKVQFDNPITNYTGSGTLSYSWLPKEGLDSAGLAQPTAEIISDKTYTLSVSTPNGCTANDSVKVTVNPLTVKVDDVVVSCGNTAQLNVVTNYTGSGSLIYNWSPASGLSSITIANPVATLRSPAEYSVEVKTPNDDCVATDNVNVSTSVISFNPSICMVTVNDSDKNVVVWQRENNPAIDSFFIFRESSNQTDQYDLIGKLPYSATGVLIDSTSDASVQSNKYKIAVKDFCGFVTNMSPEHKTMHLTINKGIGNIWNLIWEQYIGVSVSSYGIYRGTTKSDLAKIGSSSGSNTTYTDKTAPAGDVYYQIEVVLPLACSNLKSTVYSSSRSNIISSADAVTGISANSIIPTFIYPNPTSDKLNIKGEYSANAFIMIFDLQGKQVLSKQMRYRQIDISDLSKGFYTVKLVDSGNVLINKFMKE
jgi:predicted outer membrane repeat protein